MNNVKQALSFEKLLYEQVHARKEKGILGAYDNCKERRKDLIEAIKVSIVKDWLPSMHKHKGGGLDDMLEEHYDDVFGGIDSNTSDSEASNDSNESNESDTASVNSLDITAGKEKVVYVLVGAWARDWIRQGEQLCTNLEKIQLIADITPNELQHELTMYTKKITKMRITFKEQELHIPKDFRTVRYTFYMEVGSEKGIIEKPFLDLFNSANFELIPYYLVDGINIAHWYVICKFLFIDLWVVRVIKTLGLFSADILNQKIDYIWQLIEFFKDKSVDESSIKFTGTYRDFQVDKKLNNLQIKTPYPYYPEIYFDDNKKYRDV
jgi:hypothetical protein